VNLDDLGNEIAHLMSIARCGCSVYMDGKHLPTEKERIEGLYLAHLFYQHHPELEFK
jgi:hypothetical protein